MSRKPWAQLTDEERAQRRAADQAYQDAMVAETRRQFRLNRESNLRGKIKHLHTHGWHEQAESLETELAEWLEALKAKDPEPEQTVTPAIEVEFEKYAVEMPENGKWEGV